MDAVEILFTTDSNGAQSTCSAWDPRTGTNLMTYKGGGAANERGLDLIRNEFVITANSTKPLIHIWPINSQEEVPVLRFVAPASRASTLAVSPDGVYLIAGIQETLHIWEICSGKMLNSLSKHFQPITTVKFTDDGSHFISAGQDGSVLVWNLTKVVGQNDTNLLPLHTFNDHALPVTDLHVGCGGIRAFMCSVSVDRTCRMYDLASGALLLNVVFNDKLTCVTVNLLETSVFVGTNVGIIYEFNIISPPRTKEYHMTKENYTNKFEGHKDAVKCLALSVDGETLASGGQDNNVYLWHIQSRQILRTIPHKGSISNLRFTFSTKDMFNPQIKYNLIAHNLKRMMDAPSNNDNSHVIEILVDDVIGEDVYTNDSNVGEIASTKSSDSSSQEIERLREEINTLKKANQKLFEHSFKNIFNNTT